MTPHEQIVLQKQKFVEKAFDFHRVLTKAIHFNGSTNELLSIYEEMMELAYGCIDPNNSYWTWRKYLELCYTKEQFTDQELKQLLDETEI